MKLRASGLRPLLGFVSAVGFGPQAAANPTSAECRPNPFVVRAQDQYERLEFAPAYRTLQRALEQSRNCQSDLAEIYRLQGFINAVNQDRSQCKRSFEIMLALNPSFQLSKKTAPKIAQCFRKAREVALQKRVLALNHRVPSQARPNAPLTVEVSVRDPLSICDRVQVWFRRKGVDVFTTVTARSTESMSLVIPALAIPGAEQSYQLEYFVRAVDRYDGSLAEIGSTRLPLTVSVEADQRSVPVYETWWFWTLLGVVAAGAATTAIVLGTQDDSDAVEITLIDGGSGS